MRGWKTAILVQPLTRFLQRLSTKVDTALRFCLKEPEALGRRVKDHADNVVAAHRHVPVILPA